MSRIIVEFATSRKTRRGTITPEQAHILMENLKNLDEQAFSTDKQLLQELRQMPIPLGNKPLGLLLMSEREVCVLCSSKILVRSDKPSSVVVYDG